MRITLQSSLFATMLLLAGFAAAAPVGSRETGNVSGASHLTPCHI
jgi:hypothetical protein